MSSPESGHTVADSAPIFAALGDPTRLQLVSRLSDGRERSIAQLTGGLKLTRQGVTKHLRVLQNAGIVNSVRAGRENHFRFVPDRIEQVQSYLDMVSGQWDDALDRLKLLVEKQ